MSLVYAYAHALAGLGGVKRLEKAVLITDASASSTMETRRFHKISRVIGSNLLFAVVIICLLPQL